MYEDRVGAGASLLDRVRPSWWLNIDIGHLEMHTCDKCILGQLYGYYWTGFRKVLMPLPSSELFAASDLGFTLPDEEQQDDDPATMARFAALADTWRAAIRARSGGGT